MASVSEPLGYSVEIKATDHLQMQVIIVFSQGDLAGTGSGTSRCGSRDNRLNEIENSGGAGDSRQ
jgi:hypothetical protein